MTSATSIRDFANRLKAQKYVDGASEGFLLEHVGQSHINAAFVERIERTEAVIDPFGKEEQFDFVEYRKTEFIVSKGRRGFEIKDANRSSSRLISKLLEAMDFDFTIMPMVLDPLIWAEKFQEHANRRGVIDKVQIGSLRIGDDAMAQLSVKGLPNAAAAAIRFVGDAPYKIERVQLRLPAKQGSIVFLASGSVTITSDFEGNLLDQIRSTLATL